MDVVDIEIVQRQYVQTAELVVALAVELDRAQSLATRIGAEGAALGAGDEEVLQLAAERVVERVFQATVLLPDVLQLEYFGEEPLRCLPGMRNRLAHNYLAVESRIFRETIQDDLALVRVALERDVEQAGRVLALPMSNSIDTVHWGPKHLSEL